MKYLGLFAILVGCFLIYLSRKSWYVEWVQKNFIPEAKEQLKVHEQRGALVLILVGVYIVYISF